jgi:hemolysin activation/secretion protein
MLQCSGKPHPSLLRLLALALCAACWVQPGTTGAQTTLTPGAVQDTLPPPKPPVPAAPAQLVFPVAPPPIEHDRNARRFTVNSFRFSGNTVYSERTLKRLVERFLDLQLNLYDLTRAADVVTQLYRDEGYLIARAVIPAQKVEQGIVHIEIIEGRVGRVIFEGNRRYSRAALQRRMPGLAPGVLITSGAMEHDLLLLNDLPGLTARATLEPGKEFGTTDIRIRVEEKTFSGYVQPNNQGRKEIGQWRTDGGVNVNNMLGFGDQLSFQGIVSQSNLMHYSRLGYSIPLTAQGTRLELGYAATDYSLAGDLAVLDIEGDVRSREISVVHPYLRSRSQNLSFNLGYRTTRLRQRALGVEISDNSIGLYNPGVRYSQIGADASVSTLSTQFYTNFRTNTSGTRQDAEQLKVELEGTHLRGLNRNWDLYLRGLVVQSHEPLADSEKFALGGPGNVRGYRSSELRGDKGWLATVELRRQISVFNTLGLVGFFYDAGVVKFQAPGFLDGSTTLMSAGANVTFFPLRNVPIKLEFAVPVRNTIASDGHNNGRLWLSVGASF